MKTIKLIALVLLMPVWLFAQSSFQGTLTGEQGFPSVQTQAYGNVEAELNGNTLVISGSFGNLFSPVDTQIAGGAHIHSGLAGKTGPVVLILDADLNPNGLGGVFKPSKNTFQLSAGEIEMLLGREFYVNIHTENFSSGELRGQILPASDSYFQAALSGNQEVPAVLSTGEGMVMMELVGNQLSLSGSFSNLNTPFNPNVAMGAHLHSGLPGENGGVVYFLETEITNGNSTSGQFNVFDNTILVNDLDELSLLIDGKMYVNIHSQDIPSGEIKGQVLAVIKFFPAKGPEITFPSDGNQITIEGLPETTFEISWNEVASDENLPCIYHWELALDPEFEETLIYVNGGSSTSISFSFRDIDDLLEENQVQVGQTVELYHRAITSDGSLQTPGEALSVGLTRGVVTNTSEVTDFKNSFDLFPNPVKIGSSPIIAIQSDVEKMVTLTIMDVTGRVLNNQDVLLNSGANSFQPNFNFNQTGLYLISISDGDNRSEIRRISVLD